MKFRIIKRTFFSPRKCSLAALFVFLLHSPLLCQTKDSISESPLTESQHSLTEKSNNDTSSSIDSVHHSEKNKDNDISYLFEVGRDSINHFFNHHNWYDAYRVSLQLYVTALDGNAVDKLDESKLLISRSLIALGEMDQALFILESVDVEDGTDFAIQIAKLKALIDCGSRRVEQGIKQLISILGKSDCDQCNDVYLLLNISSAYLSNHDVQQAMHYLRLAESHAQSKDPIPTHIDYYLSTSKSQIYAILQDEENFRIEIDRLKNEFSQYTASYEIPLKEALFRYYENKNLPQLLKSYEKTIISLEQLGEWHYYIVLTHFMLDLAEKESDDEMIKKLYGNLEKVHSRNKKALSYLDKTTLKLPEKTDDTSRTSSIFFFALSILLLFDLIYTLTVSIRLKRNPAVKSDKATREFSNSDLELIGKLDAYFSNEENICSNKLNLNELSKNINTNTSTLSELINRKYQMNLPTLINHYRIDIFCRMVNNGEAQKYSIETITEILGYGSKSSFYKNFNSKMGITPAQYIKEKSFQK